MKYVADENQLEFNKDVKLLTIGNSSRFTDYLAENQNKTKYGVVFCLDSLNLFNTSIPCNFEFFNATFNLYTLVYNISSAPNGFLAGPNTPWPTYPALAKLKQDMDNGYMNYYSDLRGINPAPKLNLTLQSFPIAQNRFFSKADVVASSGAFYFFFPPVISFVMILLEIIKEKDSKLRKSLLIIGLNNSPFWISWLLTSIIFSSLISIILVTVSIIFRFEVFTNSPFLITFYLFFLFTLTMQFLAFFLSTILKSIRSAYTVNIYKINSVRFLMH